MLKVPFCPFLGIKNKNQIFSKMVVCGNKKYFCFLLMRVVFYLEAMPNSIDFHQGIFLHVIAVCIIAA